MTNPSRLDLDQDLARLGAFQIKLNNFKGFSGLKGNGGSGLHGQGSKSVRDFA